MSAAVKSPQQIAHEIAYEFMANTYYAKLTTALSRIQTSPSHWSSDQYLAWTEAVTEFVNNISNLRYKYRTITNLEAPNIPLLKGWQ
jgi:hypothetical protein